MSVEIDQLRRDHAVLQTEVRLWKHRCNTLVLGITKRPHNPEDNDVGHAIQALEAERAQRAAAQPVERGHQWALILGGEEDVERYRAFRERIARGFTQTPDERIMARAALVQLPDARGLLLPRDVSNEAVDAYLNDIEEQASSLDLDGARSNYVAAQANWHFCLGEMDRLRQKVAELRALVSPDDLSEEG